MVRQRSSPSHWPSFAPSGRLPGFPDFIARMGPSDYRTPSGRLRFPLAPRYLQGGSSFLARHRAYPHGEVPLGVWSPGLRFPGVFLVEGEVLPGYWADLFDRAALRDPAIPTPTRHDADVDVAFQPPEALGDGIHPISGLD
jgi:hypothetical protein